MLWRSHLTSLSPGRILLSSKPLNLGLHWPKSLKTLPFYIRRNLLELSP
jgi:hypothetical protein